MATVIKDLLKEEAHPDSDIHTGKYNQAIKDGMPSVLGYATILIDRSGRRIAFVRRGWAVSPLDRKFGADSQPFTLDTMVPWGSNSKLITTALVCRTIERIDDRSLDDRFVDFLPRRWFADADSRFRDVTLRMLLQHRGGFRHMSESPWHPSKFRARLKSGDVLTGKAIVFPPEVGERQYANSNMGIFHYIFGSLRLGHSWAFALEDRMKNLNDERYDEVAAAANAKVYREGVLKMLSTLGVEAGCDVRALREAGRPIALGYSTNDFTSGTEPSDACAHPAAGGWLLSTKGMLAFLHALRHDRQLLSSSMSDLIENREQPDARLGWARLQESYDGGSALAHYGDRGAYHSYVVSLPNGYRAGIVTNTGLGEERLGPIVRDAYNAALLPAGAKPVP